MCGICGYIGESKNPEITFDLVSNLFEKTEIRGEDAAGIWGAVDDKKAIYHKEPVKSSIFVKKPMWAKVGELNPNLLLCHARAASVGVGVPAINKNNHPFLSQDGRIGLVHNGRIPDVEYRALKKKFPTASNCDSEILLRIFEASDGADQARVQEFEAYDPAVAARLSGLKDIWSFLSLGHMAVAIGETKDNGVRRLWLFRNKHRSLWLADLRKSLGQVFFFSVPQIWKAAVDKCPSVKPYISGGVQLIELPTEEIWLFTTHPNLPLTKRNALKRFEVCSSGSYTALQEDQISVPSVERTEKIELITGLEEDDKIVTDDDDDNQIIGFQGNYTPPSNYNALVSASHTTGADTQTQTQTTPTESKTMSFPQQSEEIDANSIDTLCDSITNIADQIKTVFNNQMIQASVSTSDYQDIRTQLEQIELDLTGTLHIIER